MDDETRKRLEYEEQFFGMSSRFFADSFKNFLKDELEEKVSILVNDFKKKIINQSQDPERFEYAVKEMKQSLMNVYNESLEKEFPEIEQKVAGFMNIPSHVLLKEDLVVRDGLNQNINELQEEIDNLKGTFQSLLYLKKEMMEELEEADMAIHYMNIITSNKKLNLDILKEEISSPSKENVCLLNNELK